MSRADRRYDDCLNENTCVGRFDRETCRAGQPMEEGKRVQSKRTKEICNGRLLEDEKDALDGECG